MFPDYITWVDVSLTITSFNEGTMRTDSGADADSADDLALSSSSLLGWRGFGNAFMASK